MIIFLSYAKEDVDRVGKFHSALKESGYRPWMDKYDILPGQNWQFEIDKAVATCDAAIVFLSQRSVAKTGYVQAELSEFLEQKKLRPEGAIYLIPARLDSCEIPRSLSGLQYVNLFEDHGVQRIIEALEYARNQQSLARQIGEARGQFNVLTKVIEEHWEGLPGYSVNLEYPQFHDGVSCEDINLSLRAECVSKLFQIRSCRMDQRPDFFGKSSPDFATNKEVMNYKATFVSAFAISIVYNIIGYGAGGAHGYAKYKTNNFLLEPTTDLPLHLFFNRYGNYVERLKEEIKNSLRQKGRERNNIKFEEEQLNSGIRLQPWDNPEFTFDAEGLTFYFQQYQIGPYAIGRWEVTLPFDTLREILRSDGLHRLIGVP